MKIRKNRILLIVAPAIFIVLIVAFLFSPYSTALFKSKSHFIQHSLVHNVYYEPGVEVYADSIALFLQRAVDKVELVHGLPFEDSFNVYVCNTQKSLNEFAAITSTPYPIRGTVMLGDVFIAPSAFNFIGRDTHKQALIYLLSLLHFRQRLGFFKRRKHPIWFYEGFADYVAGSGGEGIEDREAINFILNGRHFISEEDCEIFGAVKKASNDLSGPMFHKQVKMFVTFIIESDSLKFKSFIREIQNGESFNESFNKTISSGIREKWKEFVLHLKSDKDYIKNRGLIDG